MAEPRITIANRQELVMIDKGWLKELARFVLTAENRTKAQISLALVDNATIHELNRRFLQHDFATDVLTFPLADSPSRLEGEIVISAEYANDVCGEYGWSADIELALYVVHGLLHLCGYDDQDEEAASQMRDRQAELLDQFRATHPAPRAERTPAPHSPSPPASGGHAHQ